MARRMTMAFLFALAAGFVGAVLCSSFTPTAFGQDEQTVQVTPSMLHKMGLSGISGEQDYLYVMAGGKIMAYQTSDMSLLKTVDLPDPPADALPPKPDVTQPPPSFPHPHGGGPHGLWAGNRYLFVLAGPVIYEYTTPDLTLVSTKVLPKPELPVSTN